MSILAAASYSLPDKDGDPAASDELDAASLGRRETRWEVVYTAPGITPAMIIVGRLQAEGIPARAWQEGAGRAYGITVGLLGAGYVLVPEPFAEQARAILTDSYDEEE